MIVISNLLIIIFKYLLFNDNVIYDCCLIEPILERLSSSYFHFHYKSSNL